MINLKAFAGDRYRLGLDESARDDPVRANRVWYYRIPCKHGFISVHGPDTLAAWTGKRGMISRLTGIEGVRAHQRGDDEVRVLFSPDRLDAVADVMKARRRRRLSAEMRAAAIARLSGARKTA